MVVSRTAVFMAGKDCCGFDMTRPDMNVIMDRARGNGMQIGKNGIDVARLYLLPGLLLFSILNLVVVSEALDVVVAPPALAPPAPAPASQDIPPPGLGSSPFSPPPPAATALPPTSETVPPVVKPSPPLAFDVGLPPGLFRIPPPPPLVESPPPADVASPSPPPSTVADPGDTWNESEKAGVVIASLAALLQVAVVVFLLIKRHQMLTTVEYDDIDDLEYDHPRDPNSRHAESA